MILTSAQPYVLAQWNGLVDPRQIQTQIHFPCFLQARRVILLQPAQRGKGHIRNRGPCGFCLEVMGAERLMLAPTRGSRCQHIQGSALDPPRAAASHILAVFWPHAHGKAASRALQRALNILVATPDRLLRPRTGHTPMLGSPTIVVLEAGTRPHVGHRIRTGYPQDDGHDPPIKNKVLLLRQRLVSRILKILWIHRQHPHNDRRSPTLQGPGNSKTSVASGQEAPALRAVLLQPPTCTPSCSSPSNRRRRCVSRS